MWLSPKPGTFSSTSIDLIMQHVRSLVDTPVFSPHVTVTSGLANYQDIIESIVSMLRKAKSSETLRLCEVEQHDRYFKRVVISLESEFIMDFEREITTRPPQNSYEPHISLAYSESRLSAECMHNIADIVLGILHLKSLDQLSTVQLPLADFYMQVVLCEGPVEGWKVVYSEDIEDL